MGYQGHGIDNLGRKDLKWLDPFFLTEVIGTIFVEASSGLG
jgi:hypothetical protein